MPTYEYECRSCGHAFEKFQPITATPIRRCPVCGKSVRRLIGNGAGVIFKGSGFYETDYRSSDYQKQAKSEEPTPMTDSSSTAGSQADGTTSPKKETPSATRGGKKPKP